MKTKFLHLAFAFLCASLLSATAYAAGGGFQYVLESGQSNTDLTVTQNFDNDGYLLTSSQFNSDLTGSDIVLTNVDANGNVVWRRVIDIADNDRALSVAITEGGYWISGSATFNTLQKSFLLKVDKNGHMVGQPFMYHGIAPTYNNFGTSVIGTADGGALMTGYFADGFDNDSDKETMIIKVNENGKYLWTRSFDSSPGVFANENDFDIAENAIEIPGVGYFVSGTMNVVKYNSGAPSSIEAGVMAMLIDLNGNTIWNKSFFGSTSEGEWENAADAYFDAGTNSIFLLSNHYGLNAFAINQIDLLSGNILATETYGDVVTNDFRFMGMSIIGGQDANSLIVAGYRADNIEVTESVPPFVVEIDKYSLAMKGNAMVYETPSTGYSDLGGMFSIDPEQQALYTPAMITKGLADGYVIGGVSTEHSSNYAISITKTKEGLMGGCTAREYELFSAPSGLVINSFPMAGFSVTDYNLRLSYLYPTMGSSVAVTAYTCGASDDAAKFGSLDSSPAPVLSSDGPLINVSLLANPVVSGRAYVVVTHPFHNQYPLANVMIFDALGSVMYHSKLPTDGSPTAIDVSMWPNGVYYVRAYLKGQTHTVKMIVNN